MGKKGREWQDTAWRSTDASWAYWGSRKTKQSWEDQPDPAPKSKAQRFPTYQQTTVAEPTQAPDVDDELEPLGLESGSTQHYMRDLQRSLTQCRKAANKLRKLQELRTTRDRQWQQYQKELKSTFLEQQRQYSRDAAALDKELEAALQASREAVSLVRAMANNRGEKAEAPMQVADFSQEEDDAWESLVGTPMLPAGPLTQDAMLAQALQAAHDLTSSVQVASQPVRKPQLITVTPKRGTSQGTPRTVQRQTCQEQGQRRPDAPPVQFPATLLPPRVGTQYASPLPAAVDPYMPSPAHQHSVLGPHSISPPPRSASRPKQRTSVKEASRSVKQTANLAESHLLQAELARQSKLQEKRDQLLAAQHVQLDADAAGPAHTERPPGAPTILLDDGDEDAASDMQAPSCPELGRME